jgi:lipopolysaccharide/colanic/teichoic acid biosynthesis glycosyltransferase
MFGHLTYREHGKRALDAAIAAVALAACAPLLAAIAVAVRWRLGSPVLFVQPRPGRHGRVFRMVKFRTMTDARDADGRLLPDEQRLTPLGRWLRSTSLDELPELWHVLRGEMSLVGPRPLLVDYLPHYAPRQQRRHDVRPGITGWAQVHGRNAISWGERLELDAWYVDHATLWLDVRILVRTVAAVVARRGIAAASHATMPRFDEPSAAEVRHDDAA